MKSYERAQAIEDRLDSLLEQVPDNPIYQDHESRAIFNYLQALKILYQMREEGKANDEHF